MHAGTEHEVSPLRSVEEARLVCDALTCELTLTVHCWGGGAGLMAAAVRIGERLCLLVLPGIMSAATSARPP